jgi:hypothetical protein
MKRNQSFFSTPKEDKEKDVSSALNSIVGINLVAMSSQEEILPMEEEHVQEQTYLLAEAM